MTSSPTPHTEPLNTTEVDVLVVGAGPTGLTAAAEALRHGMSVRIIERLPTRGTFSKALVVHARTMEVFALMGIDRKIRDRGLPFAALNLNFNNRKRRVRVDLLDQPWGDTAYPYWLSLPQHDTENVLENHLNSLGAEVEWSTTLLSLHESGEVVDASVSRAGGTELIRARWVIGCDGGRSVVRDQAGMALNRTGAGATFLLADVKTTCDLVEDEGHMFLAAEGLLIIVPMPEPRQWRVIAHVATAPEAAPNTIDSESLDRLISDRAGIQFGAHDVTWTSQFDLSHGVADRFRAGRVFLAGDAAHIHSPVGGQGLNTGVQDAHNLMWRVAQSRHATPESREKLFNDYEAERRSSALAMVGGVARVTSLMTSRRRIVQLMRRSIAPLVLSRRFVQAKLARGVGMLNLSYAKGVSLAGAKNVRVGQRLPNPVLREGGRLHDRLSGSGYRWVLLGSPATSADALDPGRECWVGLPLVRVPDTDLADPARDGNRNRIVLVRPDLYIAAEGKSPTRALKSQEVIQEVTRSVDLVREGTGQNGVHARTDINP